MLSKKNKLLLFLFLALLFLGSGAAGVWWMLQPSSVPVPAISRAPESKTTVPGVATPKGEKKEPSGADQPVKSAPASGQGETQTQVPQSVPVSGSLAELTLLRAKLQNLDARVAIAEREKKLGKLETPDLVPAEPVIVQSPSSLPLALPHYPEQREQRNADRPREPRVVSVQGINGEPLSATIRTTSGSLVAVRHGDRFAGGTAEVSRSGVFIRSGRSVKSLSFE